MNQEQAIGVLLQVAELAQSRGILKLNEATVVFQAVSVLSPEKENVTTDVPETASKEPVKGQRRVK